MPYIKQDRRDALINDSVTDHDDMPNCAGDLNYRFTLEIAYYMRRKGLSYQTANDIVGALDNCKDEFKRRFLYPYEDLKILENGDIEELRDTKIALDEAIVKQIRTTTKKRKK